TLPQLLSALRGEGGLVADLEGIKAVADRVAAGEEAFFQDAPATHEAEAPAASGEQAAEAAPASGATTAEDPGTPASVDAVLLEILDAEIEGHLATLDGWLASARAGS